MLGSLSFSLYFSLRIKIEQVSFLNYEFPSLNIFQAKK